MRIYLIRHADPYYPTDSLTPAGHLEAQALADLLAGLGLDEIYSSPRGRARLTAAYTAERLHLPVTIEPWTTELVGLDLAEYQHAVWDMDGAVLRAPQVLANLNRWQEHAPLDHPRIPEHMALIQSGSDDFMRRQGYLRQRTVYQMEQPNQKRIALFSHLGFGLAWLAYLLDIPLPLMWAGFFLQPSSVTTILFEERTPGQAMPRLLGLGDLSHLVRAGLPPSNSGLIANIE